MRQRDREPIGDLERTALRDHYEVEGAQTERYDSSSYWDARYHIRRKAHIDRLLETIVAPGDSFLDVGCGTGEYLATARELGASSVVGIDLAMSYLNRLKTEPSTFSLVQADGSLLPFADGSFDVVLCSEVIEHVPRETVHAVACELRRVTRRCVLVTTPNRTAAIRRLARRVAPNRVEQLDAEVGHINLLSSADLRAAGELAGLRPTTFEVRHIAPPVLGELGHLPALFDPVVSALERLADRWVAPPGNTMYAVLEPSN